MVRVKVCGITSIDDALVAVGAGADAIGLVFHPTSPRRVSWAAAAAISQRVGGLVERVGVFVDADPTLLEEACRALELDALQVHQRSCPRSLTERLPVPIRPVVDLGDEGMAAIDWGADLPIVLDNLRPDGSGGSGRSGGWLQAAAIAGHRPVWLAGGLGPDNVAAAVAQVRPLGVDASSRLEKSPGVKDPALVARFVSAARSVER